MARSVAKKDLKTKITSALQQMLEPYGFGPPFTLDYTMGGWRSSMETTEFIVTASQDRSGDALGICVGSKYRRKPRAHMRGPWSLSHLRGYIDGERKHYLFKDPSEELNWLHANIDELLNTSFLNSDELNTWAVNASRRRFGQDPR